VANGQCLCVRCHGKKTRAEQNSGALDAKKSEKRSQPAKIFDGRAV
jgi:hypothetical protein